MVGLHGAVLPTDAIRVLRLLWRQRATMLRDQGRRVQHMRKKALTQMNIQLANVITDIVGESGQKILRAIVAGERDGHALAKLKHFRVRASNEEIAKSLQGNWRSEHLFTLQQALASSSTLIGTQLAQCEAAIDAAVDHPSRTWHDGSPPRSASAGKPATRPSSICAHSSSRSVAWTSRASTVSR